MADLSRSLTLLVLAACGAPQRSASIAAVPAPAPARPVAAAPDACRDVSTIAGPRLASGATAIELCTFGDPRRATLVLATKEGARTEIELGRWRAGEHEAWRFEGAIDRGVLIARTGGGADELREYTLGETGWSERVLVHARRVEAIADGAAYTVMACKSDAIECVPAPAMVVHRDGSVVEQL